jgi:prevent-host-death family protein
MKQMGAGAFKARCLSIIRDIQATGEPVLVTKNGKPLVKVVPAESEKDNLFGFMAGKFKITGDIESPVWPQKKRDLSSRRSSRTKPRAKSCA